MESDPQCVKLHFHTSISDIPFNQKCGSLPDIVINIKNIIVWIHILL